MRLLVLGGTRSGKSAHAESVAAASGVDVVYVATARRDPDDDEMAVRIAAHRDRRPEEWATEETDEIARVLGEHPRSTVLVDDLGGWLTRRMDATLGWTDGGATVAGEVDELVSAVADHPGPLVLVSPEVGLGVVPDTLSGRLFSDLMGSLNRRVAEVCDSAVLVVAGRALPLSSPGDSAATVPLPGETAVPSPARPEDATSAPAGGDTPVATPEGSEAPTPGTTPSPPHEFPGLGDVDHYDDPVVFPPVHPPSHAVADEARARQLVLTKPAGSLGRLEELGVWISSCQGACPPRPLERARVVVFAGDHGIAENGVSAYPREVTLQMADNIVGGGAAVSVLARAARATVRVADMSMSAERPGGLDDHKIRRSSGSIDREDALTPDEVRAAIAAGRRIADDEVDSGADLLIAGDLGIGNTTPSTVITCLVTGREPVELVGRGTGIDDEGWMRKTAAIRDAMFRASGDLRDPVAMLRRVAGADLAAMAGFLAQAAVRRTPCILDGAVVTAAALLAESLAPGARQWWVAGHRSAEPAHSAALTYLSLEPILEHSMRLGEGSGAVAALPTVHAAIAILTEMATFADAGVSGKD
ncbi:nicotinate-nucleotide--dimethylbenzimidazole phosphoribosyltransferase [Dietzia sp. PP-33]|jgi:nicotinate-nucleotide--dimethylbenzimidazole phosphoribosyltransferase|uniref:nicotinate-nucleotide--dimethylbenzimidazole phosphoribosyltransferase n=1 Tax=Dietzia sp. PP-33 TaxID=2957500 RepID=UPI0029BB1781|nr:nicotinate-nucleotide--dimethylbenzimidazole phosphoribosyltransferase [Dietzia sp. PP-33]MDX2357415.1 nicotinate-nucleotide--dimethylbenzimidazole phosphoribosyltransferase [Dietzia sp. PP-33]